MRYGKISEAMWTDKTFRRLSHCAKLLYVYLLSCSKCTAIGLFQLGLGTMEDEFGEDREKIRQGLEELGAEGLCTYEDGWVCFNKYIKWNAPTSPNHARQIAFFVNEEIKKEPPLKAVANVLHQCKTVLSGMKTAKGTYFEDFRKALDMPLLTQFVGGESILRNCFEKGVIESPAKALPKHSTRAFKNEGLNEGSQSTGEGLTSQTQTQTQTQTKQSRAYNSAQCLIVARQDGEVLKISPSLVKAVTRDWGWDIDTLQGVAQRYLDSHPDDVIDDPDLWFLDLVHSFNATRGS